MTAPRAEADLVLVEEVELGHLVVTLNDPDRLNPLSTPLVRRLHEVLDAVAADRTVRGVVLTGAGRGFCSGANMAPEPDEADTAPAPGQNPVSHVLGVQDRIASLHEKIHRLKVPVVAAVNGPAVGGGFSLTLACDLRFAAASAKFGAVFIKVGVSAADMGTSYFLPRIVGVTRAAELMMTGRVFGAAEAERYGVALEVVEDGTVVERALEQLRAITVNSPLGVWMTKETMWHNVDARSLREAIEVENRTQIMCLGSGEMERVVEGFATRSVPDWMSL